ncbi:exported hypothetical protein [Candidatus Sulfopaludibacter sp. SbA4]|nr:exported hypothetical protein [Candidatus Sulfopaludibacter sp. SbA4]
MSTRGCFLFLVFTALIHAQLVQQGGKLVSASAVGLATQGQSVALSSDGNTALAGSPGDSRGVGAAFVYIRGNGVWTQQAKLVGTDASGLAQQGFSVALSADGNTALLGGPKDSGGTGAAWAFVRNSGGTWSQQGAKLVGFGASGGASQGYSVGLSPNGIWAIVGGPTDSGGTGAAWLFIQSNGVWSQASFKLSGSGATAAAAQGTSVAVNDKTTVVVGGPGDSNSVGAVWIFFGGMLPEGKFVGTGNAGQSQQGSAVALFGDTLLLVGGRGDNNNAGAAWVFTSSGGPWTQQGNKLTGSGASGAAQQGSSASLSGDGNTAMIGGPADNSGAGAAWIFKSSGGAFSQQGGKLSGTGATGAAAQGTSVALSSDGSTALLGGPNDSSGAGAAWVFAPPGPATRFTVSAAASASAGTAINFTVTALDANNNTATGYSGKVHFTSSDSAATLPADATLASGTETFSATLQTAGSRTITATDTATSSITGTSGAIAVAAVIVSGTPSPIGVNPPAASTATQTLAFTFSDTSSAQDLGVVNILINNFLDGRHACYLAYSQPVNTLFLIDDAGDGGGSFAGSAVLAATGAIQNSQCAVSWSSTPVTRNGNNLTLTFTIAFTSSFAGNKIVYMAAGNVAGTNSGWQALGVSQVPGGAPGGTIAVAGMTPNRVTGQGSTAYTFNFSDSKGSSDIGVINILINNFIDGRHGCFLAYAQSINTLYLVDDAGDAPGPYAGTAVLNAAGTIQNSQCVVSWGNSPVSGTGNNLSLALSIAFTAAFDGDRVFYLAARDGNGGNNTDWQAMGTAAVQ